MLAKLLATDGYIAVNKTLIKILGLECAVLIGELCSEYNYWYESGELIDDMFYSVQSNIEENTGLNEYAQRKIIKKLQELDLVSVVKKDIPAKNYYKINFDKLGNLLRTSSLNFKALEVENLKINNNKNYNKKNNISKDILSEKEYKSKIDYKEIQNLFNSICISYPKIKKLSNDRKKHIAARFADGYTVDDFKRAFELAEDSEFLKGNHNSKTHSTFKADFDWIIRDRNMIKVLEEKYNSNKPKAKEPIDDDWLNGLE